MNIEDLPNKHFDAETLNLLLSLVKYADTYYYRNLWSEVQRNMPKNIFNFTIKYRNTKEVFKAVKSDSRERLIHNLPSQGAIISFLLEYSLKSSVVSGL